MGSKGSQTQTTDSSQTYTPNPVIGNAGTQAISMATNAASQPFQMPVAPVAGFTPFQNQAFDQIQNMQGMAQPYFNVGANYLAQSADPISANEVGNYYNPMAQNVFANMRDTFGQQMRETTGKLTQAAGGVGADRIAVGQANLAKEQQLATGQMAAQLYQPALAAAQQDRQRQAGAGYGFAQMGPAAQNAYLSGTQALAGAGAQQQQLGQQGLNALYQNRLAQIAYPFQTAQYLAGITGGLAPAMGGTTSGQSTTTQSGPSGLAQALGIGTSLLGLGGMTGMFGGGSGKGSGGGWVNPDSAGYQAPNFGGQWYNQGTGMNPYMLYADGGGIVDGNPDVMHQLYFPQGKEKLRDEWLRNQLDTVNPLDGWMTGERAYNDTPTNAQRRRDLAENPYDAQRLRREGDLMERNGQSDRFWSNFGSKEDIHLADGGAADDSDQNDRLPQFPQLSDAASPIPMIKLPAGSGQFHNNLQFPKPSSGGSGSGGGSDIGKAVSSMANMAMMFLKNGGTVNPYDMGRGFDDGGAATFDSRFSGGDSFADRFNALPASPDYGPSPWSTSPVGMQASAQGNVPLPQARLSEPVMSGNEYTRQNFPGDMSPAIPMPPQLASSFKPTFPVPQGGPQYVNAPLNIRPDGTAPNRPPSIFDGSATAEAVDMPQSKAGMRPPGGGTGGNPYQLPVMNADMKVSDYEMPRNQQPYPDSLDRDWGQKAVRNPWMALVKAGAEMASTRGNFGQVIGAGIKAGVGELEGQRKELRGEQEINMKAQQLFRQAKQHLDQYQRTTPYHQAISNVRQQNADIRAGGKERVIGYTEDKRPILLNDTTQEMRVGDIQVANPTGSGANKTTTLERNAKYLVNIKAAPDEATAAKMLRDSVTKPEVFGRLVQAEKKRIAMTPNGVGMTEQQLTDLATKNVREYGQMANQQQSAPQTNEIPSRVTQNGRIFERQPDGSMKDMGPAQ